MDGNKKLNDELIATRQAYLMLSDAVREAEDKAEGLRTKKEIAQNKYEDVLRQFDARYSK